MNSPTKLSNATTLAGGVRAANRDAVHRARGDARATRRESCRSPAAGLRRTACGAPERSSSSGHRAAKARLVMLAHDAEFACPDRDRILAGAVVAADHDNGDSREIRSRPGPASAENRGLRPARGSPRSPRKSAARVRSSRSKSPVASLTSVSIGDDLALDLLAPARPRPRVRVRRGRTTRRARPTDACSNDTIGSFSVARDLEDRMEHRAHGSAEMMKIFEQAIDDERAIGGHGLDDGERIVVDRRGTDSTRAITGSVRDGKEFVRRLHQRQRRLAGTRIAIVGSGSRANSRSAKAETRARRRREDSCSINFGIRSRSPRRHLVDSSAGRISAATELARSIIISRSRRHSLRNIAGIN